MAEFPDQKRRTSPWIVACLAGCGLMVLAVGGMIGAAAWYFSGLKGRFTESIETAKDLEARFGPPERFVPWPGGPVPAERIETFLAVRESMTPQRESIRSSIAALPITASAREELKKKRGFEKLISVFGIGREAMGMGAAIGDFMRARSRSLLEKGMGMGEYEYLYLLCYGSWLRVARRDWDPPGAAVDEAGPFTLMGADDTGRVRRHLLAMLRNQEKAVPPAEAEWKGRIGREIAAMESDPGRLPWEDGLPEPMAASLEPFRERVAAAWSPYTNAFELAVGRTEGLSIQVD